MTKLIKNEQRVSLDPIYWRVKNLTSTKLQKRSTEQQVRISAYNKRTPVKPEIYYLVNSAGISQPSLKPGVPRHYRRICKVEIVSYRINSK